MGGDSYYTKSRSVEMYLASVMIGVGMTFVMPGTVQSTPITDLLDSWLNVTPFGWFGFGLITIAVGGMRWASLIINGHWHPTPLLRLFGCMGGAALWAMLAIAYYEARRQPIPISMAWPLVGIVFEIFSATRCASDAFDFDSLGLRQRRRKNNNALRSLQ